METPILCLQDMLYQMREQLTDAERPRTYSNDKQRITVDKAKAHLKRVIAELEQAIKILKEASGEKPWGLESLSVTENEGKKEFIGCTCKEEDKHGWTTIQCCNECGKPIESFWVHQ